MRASKWWIKISIPPSAFLQLWALTLQELWKLSQTATTAPCWETIDRRMGLRILGNQVRMRCSHTDLSWETKSSAEPGISTGTIAPPEPAVRLQGASGNGAALGRRTIDRCSAALNQSRYIGRGAKRQMKQKDSRQDITQTQKNPKNDTEVKSFFWRLNLKKLGM